MYYETHFLEIGALRVHLIDKFELLAERLVDFWRTTPGGPISKSAYETTPTGQEAYHLRSLVNAFAILGDLEDSPIGRDGLYLAVLAAARKLMPRLQQSTYFRSWVVTTGKGKHFASVMNLEDWAAKLVGYEGFDPHCS